MSDSANATGTARPRLYRSRDVRVVGGVCGGLAEYLRIDVVITRIIAVALLFSGSGFFLYIIAWIVMPEEPAPSQSVPGITVPTVAPPRPAAANPQQSRWLLGGVLIAIGSWWMIRNVANQIAPWLDDLILPMVLIAIGTGVVVYATKK